MNFVDLTSENIEDWKYTSNLNIYPLMIQFQDY